jgi:hypothetical protein
MAASHAVGHRLDPGRHWLPTLQRARRCPTPHMLGSTALLRGLIVVATAAMDADQRSACRRENGIYPTELQQWKENATAALSEVPEERVTPQPRRVSLR